ncbi:MAG: hypothetical protein U0694_01595 [Anaerolineae bacterium]
MSDKTWRILVVDDEPDVLAISRLTMKNFEVYGVPVEIVTASSKAQAIEVLHESLSRKESGLPLVGVAIIDVVMETDTAGLELCWYIREMMNNRLTQIYVRTGQPGIAPEREVVDRYDINGYFSKIDATEDKLYSIVKSGVRQFYFMQVAMSLSATLDQLIMASDAREDAANSGEAGSGLRRSRHEGSAVDGWRTAGHGGLTAKRKPTNSAN